MIDTHCHLDSPRFGPEREAVAARAWSAGLTGIVIPAVGPEYWDPLLEIGGGDPRIRVALGIHPQLLPELPEEEDTRHLERLDELLGRGGAIAVGECGLDGPTAARAPMARQLRVLRAHFSLARKHRLPILIHCLRVHADLMRLLRDEPLPERGILLHSFSGSPEQVGFYASHGCHFSFAGAVTFPEARRPLEAAKAVPVERLMAETDAPDQTPHPHRGERNEPGHLPLVVAALAAAHGVPAEEMARRTAENARAFFGCF